jgi:predicted nuclease with TOPRIM domain
LINRRTRSSILSLCFIFSLLKAELASAREDISVYEENLHVKDGIVKNLTKRLDELEPSTEPSARSSPGAVRKWNELELVKVNATVLSVSAENAVVATFS